MGFLKPKAPPKSEAVKAQEQRVAAETRQEQFEAKMDTKRTARRRRGRYSLLSGSETGLTDTLG